MRVVNGKFFVDGAFRGGCVETEGERISLVEVRDASGEGATRTVDSGKTRDHVRNRAQDPAPASAQPAGRGASAAAAEPVSVADDLVLDAGGCYVVPGFVDLHFHGAVGSDLCDGTREALDAMARYEASRGVTAICPATMTYPMEVLEPIARVAGAYRPEPDQAALVGINMEGPYISPNKVGAQNPGYVRAASLSEVRRMQELSGGLVKLVDVAPEEEGNLAFIEEASRDVRISLAHTVADYDCARAAFQAGARQMTHLYNAMPGLHHREPGPIAAAAERDDVMVEIIADGVHVHPAMVRLAFKVFGAGRVILISDTMRAVGLGDGIHDLGGQDVDVRGNVATLVRTGALAGSVSDLATCLRVAVREMDVPLEDAVRAATENPSRALGIFGERGSLEAGKYADLVVLDEDLAVRQVVVRGRLL